jgi:hypothetical protein
VGASSHAPGGAAVIDVREREKSASYARASVFAPATEGLEYSTDEDEKP